MTSREYAKNLFSKWNDEDWINQPRFDKLFYDALSGQRSVNLAGVFPINFTRWRKVMRDGPDLATERELKASLLRMERRRYVYIDEDTGEGLIRSRMRRDQLEKQPNSLLSAVRILALFDSPKFAYVMLGELDRITVPTIKGTTDVAKRLRDSLAVDFKTAREHLTVVAEGMSDPLPEPFAEDFPDGLSDGIGRPGEMEPITDGIPKGFRLGSVSGSVSGSPSPPVVNHLGGGAREVSGTTAPLTDETPPPRFCPRHMPAGDPDDKACRGCEVWRKSRERWDNEQAERRQQQINDFWTEVRTCASCDETGQIEVEFGNGVRRCPKHNWEVISA